MLREMPSSAFDEWFNEYVDRPFGYQAEVHRHAELCNLTAVGFFGKKAPKYQDFVYPQFEAEDAANQDEEMDWKVMKHMFTSRFIKNE